MSEKMESDRRENSIDEAGKLEQTKTTVDGTTQMYVNNKLRLIPTPTDNPNGQYLFI